MSGIGIHKYDGQCWCGLLHGDDPYVQGVNDEKERIESIVEEQAERWKNDPMVYLTLETILRKIRGVDF